MVLPDGRAVVLERRAAALPALAALESGIGRTRIAAMLWPDSDDARRNLRQQLPRFRKRFGQDLTDGGDELRLAAGLRHDAAASTRDPLLGSLTFEDCEEFERG